MSEHQDSSDSSYCSDSSESSECSDSSDSSFCSDSSDSIDSRHEQTCLQYFGIFCISKMNYLGFGGPWVSAVSAIVLS